VEDWRKFEQSRRGPRDDGPGPPPRSLIGAGAPIQAQSRNALPLPARFFAWGEGGGSGAKWFSVEQYGKCFFLKALLHLTEFTINCDGRDIECGNQRVSGAANTQS
jgi:hypothetical protein